MQELSQIKDLTLFYESDRSKLFKANTGPNGTILLKEDITGDLSRLHNEASIRQLAGSGEQTSIMLFNGRTVLVREFIEGVSLFEVLKEERLSISRFLTLAISIANAVQELHVRQILHKDVNPKNIIIHGDEVDLIDYEFGSAINKQEVQFEPLPLLVGTVDYISPEQTGRMNRKVDHRSDYYSMGATFYEMLTGRPPFESNDVLELIHAHLAIDPKTPGEFNSSVPEVLNAVILKLLAKNAEERYQSISGLLVDLNRCQQSLNKSGTIEYFEPGQTDIAASLSISQNLYGRKKEVERMEEAFQQSVEGGKVLLTIGGYSGVGKSTLCQELYKTVSANNGIYLAGSFDVLDRQTPYLAWGRAFKQFADWLIAEEKSVQKYWSQRLHADLRGLGKIIIDLAPNFKFILPQQPELVELTGYENQLRIQFAINAFLTSLADVDHPLVLFLDDYQWADDASIELLKSAFSNYSLGHLLVLVAYRDNEVDPLHPYSRAVEEIEHNAEIEGTTIHHQTLYPLAEKDVAEMLSDTLDMQNIEVAPLSNLIYNKTQGNAFSVNKLLDSLYIQKLLQFDYKSNQWRWDLEEIKAQNLSDNIVELLLSRIKELDQNALTVVKAASVFGLQFNLSRLSMITDKSPAAIHRMLWPLIQEGSLLPSGNDYHFLPDHYEDIHRDVHFKFAHPRIQQAVYELLTVAEQTKFHFEVGNIILQKTPKAERGEYLIEIAGHFNSGYHQVLEAENREAIAKVLYEAGNNAAASAAYEVAMNFTQKAFNILRDVNDQRTNYEMAIKLLEYSFLIKEEDKQREFQREAFINAEHRYERAAVYEVIIRCLGFANKQKEAVEVAHKAMEEMGIKMPKLAKKWQVILSAILLQIKLPPKKFKDLEHLAPIQDKDYREIIKMMQAAGPSYFFSNIETYPLLIFRMIDLSMKYGNAPESVIAFASYGLILSGAMKKLEEGYNVVKESFKLLEKPGASKYAATIYFIHAGFSSHIKENIADSLDITQKGYLSGLEAGNMEYASWNLLFGCTIRLHIGSDFELLKTDALDVARFERQYNFQNQLAVVNIIHRAADMFASSINDWEEKIQQFNQQDEDDYKQGVEEGNDIYLLSYFGYKGIVNHWYGKYHQAFDLFEQFAKHAEKQVGSFFIAFYQFQRAINATQLMLHSGDQTYKGVGLKKLVIDRIKELKTLAKHNPMSYDPLVMLLEAQLQYATSGDINNKKYEDALALLQELNHPRYILMCAELYAQHLHKANDDRFEIYQNIAVNEARAMNAHAKERLLLGQQGSMSSKRGTLRVGRSSSELGSISLSSANVDTQTMIKTIEALVNEIKLEDLLGKLLLYAMENTGAQEGHFIINRDGQWVVEVCKRTRNDLLSEFPGEPLNDTELVSESIVNSAMSTQEPIVINDAQHELPFSNDSIVKKQGIRSAMCIPFINQSKISGVIYLIHNTSTDAFRKDHVNLMRLLAGQIATNIENALLYQNLEKLVEQRTKQLEDEKQKSEDLLLNILPKEVADELKNKGKASASNYASVSIMFIDIKDFTRLAEALTAEELVKDLDAFFSRFDQIITRYGLEKIKTIGDAYMAAGGIPIKNDSHPVDAVKAAMEIRDFVDQENKDREHSGRPLLQIRIGINTGPITAGVVGQKKFAYDIWGDAVNIAARIEENSAAGKINISQNTYELIKDTFDCVYRGEIPVKNKGNMNMYFVESQK